MRPILDATSAVSPRPGTATISHADLIILNRDHQQYEWSTYTRIALVCRQQTRPNFEALRAGWYRSP
jgi:hypothetical protein